MRRVVGAIVDASGRRPALVLLIALGVLAVTWRFAFAVLSNPHTDLRELLPTESPGLKAFEHQLGRLGGGATLLVVTESPQRSENERFIDDLSKRLETLRTDPKVPGLIAYVESGTKDVRAFFQSNKWLYADKVDLEDAYRTLDHQIALGSGMVEDLEDDDSPPPPAALPAHVSEPGAERSPALGLDGYRERWNRRAQEHDEFPTGYFETEDGTMAALRIVSTTSGLGDAAGDSLLGRVERVIAEMDPKSYAPGMRVGFAGDIPNAAAEKESVVSEAAWATGLAAILIAVGVAWFFGSAWSLLVIGFPALLGVGAAYAFAYFEFGYVNTTGMFLGAIILGNGINYPIVLLSRYREFRARGQEAGEARRQAVQNALRAELVGACVTSIAYGSLTVTRFRGFSQFGCIGFVGMLLVWVAMIPCVPALLVSIEWFQSKLPPWMREAPLRSRPDGSHGAISALLARATERAPWVFLALAGALAVAAVWRVPAFLRDPWEYNFDRLGSRGSKASGGVGEWSNKAERVFGGKMNIAGALMLADAPEQVPALKAQILQNDANGDAHDARPVIAGITTAWDLLPGTAAEQLEKLEVLRRIRERLTPRVLADLPEGERARVEELRPPERLRVLTPGDLPPLLRRRFQENDGRVGTVFYVRYSDWVSLSYGINLLRISRETDNVRLPDGTVVQTASRATIFAEMIRAMAHDGPRATLVSLAAVAVVVACATRNVRGTFAVLLALGLGVTWLLGVAAWSGEKLNYVNFITLPITFGIGCEYPFNVYDRSRLLGGNVTAAVQRVAGAVALCSFTTLVGYASMLFDDFQALQSFGRLAVIGEASCLTGAVVVLPALLNAMKRRAGRGIVT